MMNLHRARNEEIATIGAGLALYVVGIAYLFLDGSDGLSWMFALPVVGMGLIFVALIAFATYQDDVRERARPPGERPAH